MAERELLGIQPFDPIASPSLDSLPSSDFFTAPAAPVPTVDVYDMRRGQTFSLPSGLSENDRDYLIETEVDKKPPEGYVGTHNLLDDIGDYAIGLAAFARTLPAYPRKLQLEQAERAKELLERPFQAGDVVALLTGPTRVQIAALEKVRIRLGGDPEGRFQLASTDTENRVIENARKAIQDNLDSLVASGAIRPEDPRGQWAYDLGHGTGSVGLAIGLTVATRNPSYAALIFGGIQKAEIYEEAREAGKTPSEAAKISSIAGVAESAIEFTGNAIFLKLASKGKWLVPIITRALEEGAQEGSQQLAEEIVTMSSGVREVDIEAGAGRVAYSIALGILIGAPVATVTKIAEEVGNKEGLTSEQTDHVVELMERVRPELQERAIEIVSGLQSNVGYNKKVRPEVSDIIAKFISGEEINLEEVLGKAPVNVQNMLASVVATQAKAVDVMDVVKKGRVRELARQAETTETQIDALETEREARLEAGKPVAAIEKKIGKLTEQYRALEKKVADIQFPPQRAGLLPDVNETLDALIVEELKKQDILVKGREVTKVAGLATKESVRALKRGFSEGIKTAKKSIKEAQTAITNLIQKAPLEAKDKAKFLRTIKNIQTAEQFEKQVPVVQARVMLLMRTARKKKAREGLAKVLKLAKPQKSGAKPVSKLGKGEDVAIIQETLDDARAALGEDAKVAAAKLEALEQEVTPETALRNRMLAIAAGDESVTVEEIEGLTKEIKALIDTGKIVGKEGAAQRKKRYRELQQMGSRAVTRGKNVRRMKSVGLARRFVTRMRGVRSTLASSHNAWDDLLDIVFNKAGVDATEFIKAMRVSEELQVVKGLALDWQEKLDKIAMDIFGLKNPHQVYKKFIDDEKKTDLGEFIDAAGNPQQLDVSPAEALTLWMQLQDETINEAFTHEKGNAYTQDMLDAIQGMLDINGDGGQKNMQYGQALLDFYRADVYPKINEVYRRQYGINLPFNPKYSPIQRDRALLPLEDETRMAREDSFFEEMNHRRLPSALKSRVENIWPIARKSQSIVLMRHLNDMAHFIALADKMREVNAVFSNPRLREEIRKFHGAAMERQIGAFLENLNRGHFIRGKLAEDIYAKYMSNFALAKLAIKPSIGAKQTTSYFGMGEDIPVIDFALGTLDFFTHPRKAMKWIWDRSPLIRERGYSLNVDYARIKASDESIFRLKGRKRYERAIMSFILMGDRAPIYAGGWARIKYNMNKRSPRMSEDEAIREFESHTADTQQSTDMDKISNLQSAGPVARTFVQFMTARLALLRRELRAIRQRPRWLGGRGKISTAEFAKRMIYYHVIMPQLIQIMGSGFKWDEDRQLLALIFGQLNNIVVVGDIVMTAAINAVSEENFKLSDDIPVMQSVMNVYYAGLKLLNDDFYNEEEYWEAWFEIADEFATTAGVPLETGRNIAGGVMDINEDDVKVGLKRIYGLSERTAKGE
jgi:hypothetical protein